MGRKFCQQWTSYKNTFAAMLWARTRLNLRVILAWMAVESGGAGDRPNGARFNYLQIKGTGQAGSSNGFKVYEDQFDAARDAIANIKARPEILRAVGRGPEAQLEAIARAWPRGPGQATRVPVHSYRQALEEKFNCISVDQINDYFDLTNPELRKERQEALARMSETFGREPRQSIEDRITGALGNAVGALGENVAGALWPVLLKSSLAATGLALIGYGVVRLAGSGKPAEHVKQAVPVVAAATRTAS
jgi:hypothetical protein